VHRIEVGAGAFRLICHDLDAANLHLGTQLLQVPSEGSCPAADIDDHACRRRDELDHLLAGVLVVALTGLVAAGSRGHLLPAGWSSSLWRTWSIHWRPGARQPGTCGRCHPCRDAHDRGALARQSRPRGIGMPRFSGAASTSTRTSLWLHPHDRLV